MSNTYRANQRIAIAGLNSEQRGAVAMEYIRENAGSIGATERNMGHATRIINEVPANIRGSREGTFRWIEEQRRETREGKSAREQEAIDRSYDLVLGYWGLRHDIVAAQARGGDEPYRLPHLSNVTSDNIVGVDSWREQSMRIVDSRIAAQREQARAAEQQAETAREQAQERAEAARAEAQERAASERRQTEERREEVRVRRLSPLDAAIEEQPENKRDAVRTMLTEARAEAGRLNIAADQRIAHIRQTLRAQDGGVGTSTADRALAVLERGAEIAAERGRGTSIFNPPAAGSVRDAAPQTDITEARGTALEVARNEILPLWRPNGRAPTAQERTQLNTILGAAGQAPFRDEIFAEMHQRAEAALASGGETSSEYRAYRAAIAITRRAQHVQGERARGEDSIDKITAENVGGLFNLTYRRAGEIASRTTVPTDDQPQTTPAQQGGDQPAAQPSADGQGGSEGPAEGATPPSRPSRPRGNRVFAEGRYAVQGGDTLYEIAGDNEQLMTAITAAMPNTTDHDRQLALAIIIGRKNNIGLDRSLSVGQSLETPSSAEITAGVAAMSVTGGILADGSISYGSEVRGRSISSLVASLDAPAPAAPAVSPAAAGDQSTVESRTQQLAALFNRTIAADSQEGANLSTEEKTQLNESLSALAINGSTITDAIRTQVGAVLEGLTTQGRLSDADTALQQTIARTREELGRGQS